MARRKAHLIPNAILDQLLAGADPKSAFEAHSLLGELKKGFPNLRKDHFTLTLHHTRGPKILAWNRGRHTLN